MQLHTGRISMSKKMFFFFLLVGCLCAIKDVSAIPITINANNYSAGTDISHAISGVLLQDYYHPAYSSTITYSAAITGTQDWCGATPCPISYLNKSDRNGDYSSSLNYNQSLASIGYADSALNFLGISITSQGAINSFGFTAMSGGTSPFGIFLFDKNDNFIKSILVNFNTQSPCGVFDCWDYSSNLDLSAMSVYNIAIGGFGATYLNTLMLDVPPLSAPEAPGWALLGIGLFGLETLRKKKYLFLLRHGCEG